MKYITLLIMFVVIGSCHLNQQQTQYVKAVHNPCTGKWAVETGFGVSCEVGADKKPFQKLYYGKMGGFSWAISLNGNAPYASPVPFSDTVSNAPIGEEFQFQDSATAINSYVRVIAEPLRKIDSAKRAADSIYKCNHTYQ